MRNLEPPPKHHIICQCCSTEHIVQFSADDPDDEDSVCYISVQLIQYRSFFKRAWIALKYAFGYQCRYGHWDCTSLGPDEAQKLFEFMKNHTRVGKNDWRNMGSEAARREYPAGPRHPMEETLVSSKVFEP